MSAVILNILIVLTALHISNGLQWSAKPWCGERLTVCSVTCVNDT